ncbi:MAG: OmpA family protein, partial [bacterium]|nr:OmpA family protein [bacterium]
MNKRNISAIFMAFSLMLVAAGCKKKTPAPPPPPPKPPVVKPKPKPAVNTFVAEPSSIQRGQSSTLRWSVSNADSVSINQGIGSVQSSGTRRVFPSSSTTYTLTAKGPGGSATATARVTVTQPPPPPPPKKEPVKPPVSQVVASQVSDAFFDYDKYDIRSDAQSVLNRNAAALKKILADYPSAVITLEGHCDERGSGEYNLGLGDSRSTAAMDFLG